MRTPKRPILIILLLFAIAYTYGYWRFSRAYVQTIGISRSIDYTYRVPSFEWDDNIDPYMIMHIGPSKTGTTTIQKNSRDFTDALALDGYIYGGSSAGKKYRDITAEIFEIDNCMKQTISYLRNHTNPATKAVDVPCWASRMSDLMKIQPRNFVVSGVPDFTKTVHSKSYYDEVKVAFKDWNLLFVVTYRRYAEWLLSVLKEKSANRCVTKGVTWESNRCKNKLDFLEYHTYLKDKQGKNKFQGANYHNIDEITVGMQAANVPFKIMNFHDERQLISSLYCDIILNTPKTCLHSLTLNNEKSTHNSRDVISETCANLVYDAEKAGLINSKTQTRKEANEKCESFMEANNVTHADLPLLCPTRSILEDLLEKSLAFEQKMVPDFFASDLGEAEHIKSFWLMANERREFCDVETERLLEGESSWNGVLKKATFKNWTVSHVS